MRQVLTRPGRSGLVSNMTSSDSPASEGLLTTCSNFAFLLRMIQVIPAAAIKQRAPPTAAPITIFGVVSVEALIELESR
jgi:hypothetical protein